MKYSEVFTKPQPRNLNEVRFLTQNFQNEFNRILSINKIEAISFAESFFHQFPFQRHLSKSMAYLFRDEMGFSSGYRKLIKIFVDVTQHLSMIGRSVYNLPPIFENTYSMERIGEMVEQTAVACQAQRLGVLDTKPILLLPNSEYLANKGFLPYLANTFEIVSDSAEVSLFEKLSHIIPYFGQATKITDEIYGAGAETLPKLNRLLKKMGKRSSSFQLLDETIDKATSFLNSYDLDLKKPFVTFHIREAGFIDVTETNKLRNCNINEYILSIEWLLKQGIQVVRIGHKKMAQIDKKKGLIDLTKVQRPGEVDIYLCGKNLFFYGSHSGPSDIAHQFGAPTLITSAMDYSSAYDNMLIEFQPMRRIEDKSLIKFSEILNSELRLSHSPVPFRRAFLEPVKISEQTHLKSVKEMLELLNNGGIINMNHKYNEKKVNVNIPIDTYLTSSSLTLL